MHMWSRSSIYLSITMDRLPSAWMYCGCAGLGLMLTRQVDGQKNVFTGYLSCPGMSLGPGCLVSLTRHRSSEVFIPSPISPRARQVSDSLPQSCVQQKMTTKIGMHSM